MFIVDVQGFQYGTSFLCKEITILNTENKNYRHAIVKLPFDLNFCKYQIRNNMKWQINNLHGLEWANNELDNLEYENLGEFLKSFIEEENNAWVTNYSDVTIAVKGSSKLEWLAKLLKNYIIIDLEQKGCMPLDELRNIFKSYHCQKHNNNDICNLNCTLENAFNLYHWDMFKCNNNNDDYDHE